MVNPFIRKYVFFYGPVVKQNCSHCNTDKLWDLAQISEYFEFLGIPLLRKKIYKAVSCPVCATLQLVDPQEFRALINFAYLNRALINGKIGQREYKVRFADVEPQLDRSIYPLVNQAYKTAQEIKPYPFAYFAQNVNVEEEPSSQLLNARNQAILNQV